MEVKNFKLEQVKKEFPDKKFPPDYQLLLQEKNTKLPQKSIIKERLQLLGSLVFLMQHSSLHRRYQIYHIEQLCIHSIMHNQFRYYEKDGIPIGFVNWAFLIVNLYLITRNLG